MADNIEYEAKILSIDIEKVRSQLNSLGAAKVGTYNYARYVFDTIPASDKKWVRLRTNGESTTLTVKEIATNEITGTSEWEIEVSDFNETLDILKKIGLTPKGYQENSRELYVLNEVEVSIDSWPQLEPYLEIEGANESAVKQTALALGFSEDILDSRNTKLLYRDVGIDLDTIEELKFS